ncbi:ABC transporter permease [Burkholderia sp. 22PA0099]|uniref:ABC transporter permease n=1 Tax=Burkholderia sp. 22PA0099 TaxID=3237372 RepID=UPI0039C3AE28
MQPISGACFKCPVLSIDEVMMNFQKINRATQPFQAFIALLIIWECAVRATNTPTLILPAPSQIFVALVDGIRDGLYGRDLASTLSATALGYVVGCVAGIALGAILAEYRVLERLFYPLIVALQSLPKIALAPLFVMWFGFGMLSKTVTVALLCFFPLLVNAMTGIAAADPDRVTLLHAMAASRSQIFIHVKLPSAASSIFAGLQVSVVLALIGALVAEFIGSDSGMGIVIEATRSNLDTPGMFAALVILAVIGLVSTKVIQEIQRKVVFWERRPGILSASDAKEV